MVFGIVALIALYYSWRGMHSMNILQRFGMPIFLILFVIGMVMLANGYVLVGPGEWVVQDGVSATAMWQALSLANGQVVFQALIATDYGRFVKRSVSYVGTAGVMLVELLMIAVVMVLGAFLGFTMISHFDGSRAEQELAATDPGLIFAVVMGVLGVIFAILTQVRINVMNLYSGSSPCPTPGMCSPPNASAGNGGWCSWLRSAWCSTRSTCCSTPTSSSAVTGIMTNTWIFILLSDYFVCRKLLKLAPSSQIEFREGRVKDWNLCGMVALAAGPDAGRSGRVRCLPVALRLVRGHAAGTDRVHPAHHHHPGLAVWCSHVGRR